MKIPLKTKPAGAENVKGYVTQRLVSGGSLFLRASPYPTSHLELTKHGKTITRLAADNFNDFGRLVLTTNLFSRQCDVFLMYEVNCKRSAVPIIAASETFSEKKEYKALFAWFCTVHDKCN